MNYNLDNLFVKVSSKDILTYREALNDLHNANKDTLFPSELNARLLKFYGYHPLKVIELNSYELFKQITFKNLREIEDGSWLVDVEWIITESSKALACAKFKSKRDELLKSYDWVESSVEIDSITKDAIAEYKQLLRDLPNYLFKNIEANYKAIVNCVFPKAPELKYKNRTVKVRELTDTELEKLKYFRPTNKVNKDSYVSFLSIWSDYGFTKDFDFVNQLLKVYVKLDLDSIIRGKK